MRVVLSLAAAVAIFGSAAAAQSPKASPGSSREKATVEHDASAESALEKAFAASGDDRAALVRNLQQYLLEFPNAPRKPEVYRALVEACQRLREDSCTLNYAERLVALHPDDSDMMMIAVTYLQRKGDEESLQRASGYVTRVIDRVEKALPDERPRGEDLATWQARQKNLRGVLYYLRGKIEYSRQDYDLAAKDLETSYSIRPSASSAELLGGIAELKNDPNKAIDEYTLAFVLPDSIAGEKVDRYQIRERLGNLWRALHGNEQGLGDAILAAYDKLAPKPPAEPATPLSASANAVFTFVAHRPDGTPMALSMLRGKVVVLNFWASWCVSCSQLQPAFDDLAAAWSGEGDVVFFMVNTEKTEADAPGSAGSSDSSNKPKWDFPTIYAPGLDRLLNVRTLPAVVVLGTDGRVIYSIEHPPLKGLAASVSGAIQQGVGPSR
jgi:thiol-disulfide isomerase/thioredoxin